MFEKLPFWDGAAMFTRGTFAICFSTLNCVSQILKSEPGVSNRVELCTRLFEAFSLQVAIFHSIV